MTDNRKYYVEEFGGKLVEILEVYESFSGWYWFITEKEKEPIETDEGTDFVYFGKVYGLDTEWGDIWMKDIHDGMKNGTIWKVPKDNWWTISHVTVKHIGPKKETPNLSELYGNEDEFKQEVNSGHW